jgi:glutaminyl-tRNA synthetase
MASPNINLRDPVLYRIKHGVVHHQTGTAWCLYPTYDYTHPLSDALEGVTHSLCTLEFEDHRPLYDWCIANVSVPSRPRQIEFSRLNLEYTVMSKRRLTDLVGEAHVSGWDDPRMPTLAGLRRRGYTPAAIRVFCERIGITKSDNRVEMAMLENAIREDLDANAPRRLAVLNPLRVVLTNYPEESD